MLQSVVGLFPLLQFAEDAALAGGLDKELIAAVVTLVAVGTATQSLKLADGQFSPAAATDEACRLSLLFVSWSHFSFFIFHFSFLIYHLSFII